jgi:hypothetical protein
LFQALGGGEDVTKIGQHAYIVHFRPDPDRNPLDTDGLFNELGISIRKHQDPGIAALFCGNARLAIWTSQFSN